MTAHDMLQEARRRRLPAFVLRRLEDRAVAETLEALNPTKPPAPVWPWVLLVLVAGLLTAAAAAVVPHAEPIAQIADGSEE
jgi:hypothetical protein